MDGPLKIRTVQMTIKILRSHFKAPLTNDFQICFSATTAATILGLRILSDMKNLQSKKF